MKEIEEQFTHSELKDYEDSLKTYRDLKNSIDFAQKNARQREHTNTLESILSPAKSGIKSRTGMHL